MKTSRLVFFMMGFMFSGPVVAEFCMWVDENGVAHYAETCPEDVESTEIDIQPPPSPAQVEAAIKMSKRSAETSKAQKEITSAEQPVFIPRHTQAEIEKMEKEQQEKQCEIWQSELAELERIREWHEKQIDVKKLLNDNKCR